MKRGNMSSRDYGILSRLSGIPHRIIDLHGTDNLSEFILHELSGSECFDLPRAAYFIDNPDFNCCKGIAGYCRNEECTSIECKWKNPTHFSEHMKQANFNAKVRQINCISSGTQYEEMIKKLAQQLEINNLHFHVFNLKNNNKGFLLYENNPANEEVIAPHLSHGVALFSFCPIF